jgi:hypothetical protein
MGAIMVGETGKERLLSRQCPLDTFLLLLPEIAPTTMILVLFTPLHTE